MFKKTKNKRKKVSPFAVSEYHGQTVFLCVVRGSNEAGLFAYRKIGTKIKRLLELEVRTEKGRLERIEKCDSFRFFQYGSERYLAYSRTSSFLFRKKTENIIAKSTGTFRFGVVDRIPGEPFDAIALVSNHKHRRSFLAYFGRGSIRVASSADLKNWHASGELLAPRKGFFDSDPLHVVDAMVTEAGIFVLYEVKKSVLDKRILIGGALFSLDQPYKLLWRSREAIWKRNISKGKPSLRYLGSMIRGGNLETFWISKKNEIVSKEIVSSDIGVHRFQERVSHLRRYSGNPIIKPSEHNSWEYDATFNPAALFLEGKVHLLYRAIGENGVSVFGYASSCDGLAIDERVKEPVFTAMRPRVPVKKNAIVSNKYVSGGSWIGCEDPRVTQIGNRIYMTYVSFDGHNPPGVALTSIRTHDFLRKNWKWKRPVLISKKGEIQKNWMLFPEKINGKYAILHSITPNIAIEYVDDIDGDNLIIESQKMPGKDDHRWDNQVRGAGSPPIKTDYGWLVLYHAMDRRDPDKYKVGAMILDEKDPTRVLYRSNHPILEPAAMYENSGAKPGVVYVCGAVIKKETLFVYYGGADSVVCVATANIHEFLQDIVKKCAKNSPTKEKIINIKVKANVRR
jgi:beta-1,2-mannobiose phosphorylase / 1,2-beta-oligomannan phosphorylase